MNVPEVLEGLRARGYSLSAVNGRVRIAPAKGIGPHVREVQSAHRGEILRLLTCGLPTCPRCDSTAAVRETGIGRMVFCGACGIPFPDERRQGAA